MDDIMNGAVKNGVQGMPPGAITKPRRLAAASSCWRGSLFPGLRRDLRGGVCRLDRTATCGGKWEVVFVGDFEFIRLNPTGSDWIRVFDFFPKPSVQIPSCGWWQGRELFKKHEIAKRSQTQNAKIALFYRCEMAVLAIKNEPIKTQIKPL